MIKEGRPPKRRWTTDEEVRQGKGSFSFWSLGKVNLFYGGKSGKVLLSLESEILGQEGVRYRKKDPASSLGGTEETYPTLNLSLEDLPENYWRDWWRSYEVMVPKAISPQEIQVCPLDPTSRKELNRLGVSYVIHEEKYPTTMFWSPCRCGNKDSPFGEHDDLGYCG